MGCTTYGNKQAYSCHWVSLVNKSTSPAIPPYPGWYIARSMLWERRLLYHHRDAFNTECTEGVQHWRWCCKQVCPEVNHVYTALGPLWCRCFSVRQCRGARPPSHCAERSVWEHSFTSRHCTGTIPTSNTTLGVIDLENKKQGHAFFFVICAAAYILSPER